MGKRSRLEMGYRARRDVVLRGRDRETGWLSGHWFCGAREGAAQRGRSRGYRVARAFACEWVTRRMRIDGLRPTTGTAGMQPEFASRTPAREAKPGRRPTPGTTEFRGSDLAPTLPRSRSSPALRSIRCRSSTARTGLAPAAPERDGRWRHRPGSCTGARG